MIGADITLHGLGNRDSAFISPVRKHSGRKGLRDRSRISGLCGHKSFSGFLGNGITDPGR